MQQCGSNVNLLLSSTSYCVCNVKEGGPKSERPPIISPVRSTPLISHLTTHWFLHRYLKRGWSLLSRSFCITLSWHVPGSTRFIANRLRMRPVRSEAKHFLTSSRASASNSNIAAPIPEARTVEAGHGRSRGKCQKGCVSSQRRRRAKSSWRDAGE